MVYFIIVILSISLSFFLYKASRKRTDIIEEYLKSVHSIKEVRKKLNENYTGYVLCINPYAANIIQDVSPIHKITKDTKLDLLVFKGIDTSDSSVFFDLNLTFFPALIAIKDSKPIAEPLFVPNNQPMFKAKLEQYIKKTEVYLST